MTGDVGWVARDNVHLTLKFLGSVAAVRLDAIADALRLATTGTGSFELAVRGLGAFPSPARPRVLWAGVDDGAVQTVTLAGQVDGALTPLGFARESRAFFPHITLGRVRTPCADRRAAEALAVGGSFGRQHVERVALMRSELSPRGARYTELVGMPLGAGSGE